MLIEILMCDIRMWQCCCQRYKLIVTFKSVANATCSIPSQTETAPSSAGGLLSQVLIPSNNRCIRDWKGHKRIFYASLDIGRWRSPFRLTGGSEGITRYSRCLDISSDIKG